MILVKISSELGLLKQGPARTQNQCYERFDLTIAQTDSSAETFRFVEVSSGRHEVESIRESGNRFYGNFTQLDDEDDFLSTDSIQTAPENP